MNTRGSVTHWFQLLQRGDHQAAQPLWERYCDKLLELASTKLHGRKFAIADSEDIALSAFDSLCRALERGRFPQLNDRNDLWRVLIFITARKIAHLVRGQRAQKRNGNIQAPAKLKDNVPAWEEIMGKEPSPDFAAQIIEEYENLLERLERDDLKRIAVWKMDGYTNQEIAHKLDCVVRTVDRKLRLIRRIWEQETDDELTQKRHDS